MEFFEGAHPTYPQTLCKKPPRQPSNNLVTLNTRSGLGGRSLGFQLLQIDVVRFSLGAIRGRVLLALQLVKVLGSVVGVFLPGAATRQCDPGAYDPSGFHHSRTISIVGFQLLILSCAVPIWVNRVRRVLA